MKIFNFNLKTIVPTLFVIIFLSTSPAKSLDKFNKSERISDYFSGILLLNDNQYEKSFDFIQNNMKIRLMITAQLWSKQ